MSTLSITLLQGFRVTHSDGDAAVKFTRQAQALLAYLLLERRGNHSRKRLLGLFWGDLDEDRARRCLRTSLWRLRRALEPDPIPSGTYLVTTDANEVGFNWESDYWLDVEVFRDRLSTAVAQPAETLGPVAVQELEETVQLYDGELMDGFYDDWVVVERERLAHLYVDGLHLLMHYHKQQGDYERSLHYGRLILEQDGLREDVHREMIRLYMANGQRALALRHYELCRDSLLAELQVPPMQETQALLDLILAGDDLSAQPDLASTGTVSPGLEAPLKCLEAVLERYSEASDQLQQAIQEIKLMMSGR